MATTARLSALSEEAVQSIQTLQHKLRKATENLKAAKKEALDADACAREQAASHALNAERQRQSTLDLEQATAELRADEHSQEEVQSELEACHAEIAAAEQYQSNLANPDVHAALVERLRSMRNELAASEAEGEALRRELAETRNFHHRRDKRVLHQVQKASDERSRGQRLATEARKRADAVSARALVEQQSKSTRLHQERLGQLEVQRSQLIAELSELRSKNSAVEKRMQELRAKNSWGIGSWSCCSSRSEEHARLRLPSSRPSYGGSGAARSC
eukprot:TRINITY_DN72669_c0_g1_i1.p1 TRINITY_DN72669_c0_g1~~TRINITY_DN72669_c0_g1_i1.p1  ORF type:complete len:285 (-),score=63.57 TRINITY_DN72669_c0_g1_i1:165-989(-)